MPIADRQTTPVDDVSRHEAGLLLTGLGAILLLISLFLEWYQRGTDAFEVFEAWDLVLAVLALGALVALASRFGFGPPRPASWLVVPAAAALVIVLYALVNPPPVAAAIDDDPSTGLWLALAAAVLMSAGAVMSVARISVAFAPAGPGAAGPVGRRRAMVADPPLDEPVGAPHAGRRFARGADGEPVVEPADPVAPGAVPPTEPTRRI